MVRRTARQAGLLAERFGARRTSLQNMSSAQPGNTPGAHGRSGATAGGAELLAELTICLQKTIFLFEKYFSLFLVYGRGMLGCV